MTTGELIRAARKQAGLTQKELGARIGVSGAMIAQYETGVRTPKVDTMQRIAEPLGIAWTELYEMPEGETVLPHNEDERKKSIYTELFFDPGIQRTAAAYRTNGFTEKKNELGRLSDDDKQKRMSIVTCLSMAGEFPPDVESLVSVGFSETEAEITYKVFQKLKEEFGEMIAEKRRISEKRLIEEGYNVPQNHP